MKTIPFIKMHGLGNDYVYIDCFPEDTAALLAETDIAALARSVSDRHYGIGSDGLVLIMPSEVADIKMRMFNADGSEAEMCGNAARCIARYAYTNGLCGMEMTLETLGGIRQLVTDPQSGLVTVAMGLTLGNPHRVFWTDDLSALNAQFAHLSEDTEWADLRSKANIECACVIERNVVRMRVCERGTGETLACGTGACAVAADAMDKGLTTNEVHVLMPGGEVLVRRNEEGCIYLTGPATEVFRGTYLWEDRP